MGGTILNHWWGGGSQKTIICIQERGRGRAHTTHTHTHRRGCSDRAIRDVKMLALKIRGKQPHKPERRQPQKLEGQEHSSCSLWKGPRPSEDLGFRLPRPPELSEKTFLPVSARVTGSLLFTAV